MTNRRFMLALALAWLPAGVVAQGAPSPALTVRIDRDAFGVPHVFGETSESVLYGAGYAEAQDRLADMEQSRRRALGRLAEVLGPSAVASDVVSRQRLPDKAELMRMYGALGGEYQRMIAAYVAGVNRAIAEIEADPARRTPYEFAQWSVKPERWVLTDFLAMIASFPRGRGGSEVTNLAFLQAMTLRHGEAKGRQLFNDLVPVSDPDTPTVIPPGEDLAPAQPMPKATFLTPAPLGKAAEPVAAPGKDHSRCLVLGPQRTASGRVMMMEATADGPEIHLQGGGFDSAGFTLPSFGVPIMGRAAHHGWLVTSGHGDTTDTFAEKLNPNDPDRYWFKGQWRQMVRQTQTILVKGAAPVVREFRWTVHGPVVSEDKAGGIAYAQRFAMRGHELENWAAVVDMQRARSLAEFDAAMGKVATNFGICYGNENGEIGFWETGLMPRRVPGTDPRLPTPGTGAYEWQGFLTPAERPHTVNPKQGWIHAWNSKATMWSREGDDARMGATFRTWLGAQLAAGSHGATLADMADYNHQIWNGFGARDRANAPPFMFAPALRAAAVNADDPEVAQAVELMTSWNGLYEDHDGDGRYDNAGLTLFRAWLETAPEVLLTPVMGGWWKDIDAKRYQKYRTALLLRVLQGPAAGLPVEFDYFGGRSREAIVAETIRRTIAAVRPQFSSAAMAEWKRPIFWKYFTEEAEDPARPPLPDDDERGKALWGELGLGPKMIPLNGGEGWVGMMELTPGAPAIYTITEVGGQNQFIDPEKRSTVHLTDQVQMHAQNRFKRIDLAPEAIAATRESTVTLTYTP
ncbi:penicillin acylase family protein [Novosphingobium sp.]|uniref:penicillin acylase family protein n=1 Tax=Novosphingobium sp. TaxID=1874826 RepID=UPI0026043600|nr:penicillin acylase family protein [Novosphingobium sp.]